VLGTLFSDGDQTLWDFDKVMRRALHSTLLELQARRPGTDHVTVDDLIADRQALTTADRTHEQLHLLAFQHTLTRLGLPDDGLAQHLTTLYLDRRFAAGEASGSTEPQPPARHRTPRTPRSRPSPNSPPD
jgi:hypothetical protein